MHLILPLITVSRKRGTGIRAVLSVQAVVPQTPSACKAPVIQPWNSWQRLTSVSSCFHHLSFTLPLFPCISLLLQPNKLFFLSLIFHLFLSSSDLLWPLTSCQGRRDNLNLSDTGLVFNDFCPRAGIQSLCFFNTVLMEKCVYACACVLHIDPCVALKRWAFTPLNCDSGALSQLPVLAVASPLTAEVQQVPHPH